MEIFHHIGNQLIHKKFHVLVTKFLKNPNGKLWEYKKLKKVLCQITQPTQNSHMNIEQPLITMNFEENLMAIEPSENLNEETLREMLEDIWQHESRHSTKYFSEEYLFDQKLSPTHEPIFTNWCDTLVKRVMSMSCIIIV